MSACEGVHYTELNARHPVLDRVRATLARCEQREIVAVLAWREHAQIVLRCELTITLMQIQIIQTGRCQRISHLVTHLKPQSNTFHRFLRLDNAVYPHRLDTFNGLDGRHQYPHALQT